MGKKKAPRKGKTTSFMEACAKLTTDDLEKGNAHVDARIESLRGPTPGTLGEESRLANLQHDFSVSYRDAVDLARAVEGALRGAKNDRGEEFSPEERRLVALGERLNRVMKLLEATANAHEETK